MPAPTVDAGSYEVSLAADGKAYTRPARWASTSPFNVSVSGGTSPEFRIRDPGGTWGAWRSSSVSVVGNVVSTTITIPSVSGASASAVTESSAVTISTQGHQIQVRDTASGTAGGTVTLSWVVGSQSGALTLTTAVPAGENPWDPIPVPAGAVVLKICPVGTSFPGYTPTAEVTQAMMTAGGYNVIMMRGGTGADSLWQEVSFDGLNGSTNGLLGLGHNEAATTKRYLVINDPASSGPVTFRQPTSGASTTYVAIKSCENITFDFRHKWVGAATDELTYGLVCDGLQRDDTTIHNNWVGVRINLLNAATAPANAIIAKNLSLFGASGVGRANDGMAPGCQSFVKLGDGRGGRHKDFAWDPLLSPQVYVIDNVLVQHCKATDSTAVPFYMGLNWDAEENTHNNPARDLFLRDIISIGSGQDGGVEPKSVLAGTVEVSNCYFWKSGRKDDPDVKSRPGLSIFNDAANVLIHSNTILDSAGQGIRVTEKSPEFRNDMAAQSWPFGAVTVYNNVIARCGQTRRAVSDPAVTTDSAVGDGFTTGGTARTYNIYNNAFIDCARHGINRGNGSMNAWNNIIVGQGGSAINGDTDTDINNYTGTTASVNFADNVGSAYEFLVNNVAVYPTAGDTYTNNGSTFTVVSTKDNVNTQDATAGVIVANLTSGTSAPELNGTLTWTAGSVSSDATLTFAYYMVSDRDYHYTSSTPDDGGTPILENTVATNHPSEDKDGNAKPFGTYSDLGPYEFQGAPA